MIVNDSIEMWKSIINGYPRLNTKAAKKLNKRMLDEENLEEKERLREELIKGTMYIVIEYIDRNKLYIINNSQFDIDDIISSGLAVFIEEIDRGSILKCNTLTAILIGKFHFDLNRELIGSNRDILEVFNMSGVKFNTLLAYFIRNKEEISYFEFSNKVASLGIDTHTRFLYYLFKTIRELLEKNGLLEISDKKINEIRDLLIFTALNKIEIDINRLVIEDSSEGLIDYIGVKSVISESWEKADLTYNEQLAINRFFGLGEYEETSTIKLAHDLQYSKTRIEQFINQALRKMRKTSVAINYKREVIEGKDPQSITMKKFLLSRKKKL